MYFYRGKGVDAKNVVRQLPHCHNIEAMPLYTVTKHSGFIIICTFPDVQEASRHWSSILSLFHHGIYVSCRNPDRGIHSTSNRLAPWLTELSANKMVVRTR
jgi:hypothetical protein